MGIFYKVLAIFRRVYSCWYCCFSANFAWIDSYDDVLNKKPTESYSVLYFFMCIKYRLSALIFWDALFWHFLHCRWFSPNNFLLHTIFPGLWILLFTELWTFVHTNNFNFQQIAQSYYFRQNVTKPIYFCAFWSMNINRKV